MRTILCRKVCLIFFEILLIIFDINFTCSLEYGIYSEEPEGMKIKTVWPLQEGYVGSIIPNLNDYVNLFSECLVNIQNFQGIDLEEWNVPIFLTRFDFVVKVFSINDGKKLSSTRQSSYQVYFNDIYYLSSNLSHGKYFPLKDVSPSDTIKFRWSCFSKFDLFYPERKDAPIFYDHYNLYLKFEKNILGPSRIYLAGYIDEGKVLCIKN